MTQNSIVYRYAPMAFISGDKHIHSADIIGFVALK